MQENLDPFKEIPSQSVSELDINNASIVEINQDNPDNSVSKGFLARAGSFIVGHAQAVNYRAQYAAVALQNDPIHYSKRTLQAGFLSFEASFGNEASRYAVFGATYQATQGNTLASAFAFGLATFAIEGLAAVVAADVLSGKGTKKALEKVHQSVEKITGKNFESNKEIPLPLRAAIAMVGGTAVLLAAKQVVHPERSKEENVVSGLRTAGCMGVYFTAEGVLTGEALGSFGVPKTIVGGLLLLAGVTGMYNKYIKRKVQVGE